MSKTGLPAGLSPFVIAELPGFSPQIGRLVAMMNYVRRTTLETVAGLTIRELDHLHDPESNSIGALLAHVASVEAAYQVATFHGRGLTAAEAGRWGTALELGDRARRELRDRPLQHYTEALEIVRSRTLREFAQRDDAWLAEESAFWDRLLANNHFKWFHVFEDELNHRGQMRWLRKRLPSIGS